MTLDILLARRQHPSQPGYLKMPRALEMLDATLLASSRVRSTGSRPSTICWPRNSPRARTDASRPRCAGRGCR
jgi:hypothetical protein